ncbi:MAG: flagellar hook-length control protein FliK, partial [Mariprofundaceae bacterium]
TLVESRHLPLSSKDVKLVSPMNRGEVSTLAANRSAVGPGALSMHESEEKAEFAYSKAYTDEAVGNAAQKKALPKIDKGLVQATGLDGASETKHLVDGNRRKAEIHKAAPQPENERRSFSNASVNTGHDSGKLILPHQMVATGINAAKVAAAQDGKDDGDMDGSPQFAAITAGKGEKEMPRFRMESKTSARDGVPLMKSVPLEHKGGGEGVGDSDQLLLPNQASSTQGMTSGVEKGTFRAFAAQVPQPLTLPMVHHEVSLAIQDGKQHLEIKLHPKELGKIDIRIDSDPLKKIHIHAVFDNPVARQAFEQQLPQLRQSLQEQGLNLAGFDLSDHGRDFQGEQQQQGEFVEAAAADALARSGNAADLEKRSDASGPSGLSIRV